jgi:cytochrome bd-type quinol oxidase subunit 2
MKGVPMSSNERNESPLVFSYLELRKAIGILGIALPFVLLLGAWIIFKTGLQSSISSYYYTGMRDVLVGTLVAFGIFLYSYKGYPGDAIYGKLACGFAIGVALFPTRPAGAETGIARTVGYFHLLFTIAFFVTLIYFSYFLFTKSDQKELPKKKQQRNQVYRTCGILMAICILGIVIDVLFPSAMAWLGDRSVFWLETGAIWAFGVSWFTKGEAIAILNDED